VLLSKSKLVELLVQAAFTLGVEVLNDRSDGFIDRGGVVHLVESVLLITEELLLGSEDTAGSAESHVTDKIRSEALVMLHGVSSNQRTGSSETSLTMDGDSTLFVFGDLEEVLDDLVTRSRTIQEVEISVLDAVFLESFTVVLLVVKSYDHSNTELLEDWDVIFRSETSVTVSVSRLVTGTTESDELSWNDPVEITVLDLLIELVVSEVESLDVEPLELDGIFKTSKTVQDTTSVGRVGITGVSVLSERRLDLGEGFPGFFGGLSEDADAETAH